MKPIQVYDGDGANHGHVRQRMKDKADRAKAESLADWEDRLYKQESSFTRLIEVVEEEQQNARWNLTSAQIGSYAMMINGLVLACAGPLLLSQISDLVFVEIPALITFICGAMLLFRSKHPPNRHHPISELRDLWVPNNSNPLRPQRPPADDSYALAMFPRLNDKP